jgi:VCBS repeat protein
MKKYAGLFLLLLCSIVFAPYAAAGQIKTFVSGFAVSGAQNKDELKGTLQTLLASRLNSETIVTVDTAEGADVLVTGSYAVLGKMFSLDAVARDSAGKVLVRLFEQGGSQDELIPALTKLAQKLNGEIVKGFSAPAAKPALPVQVPPAAAGAQPLTVTPSIIKKEAAAAPSTEIVKAEPVANISGSGWTSQRLSGALVGLALGRTLENGVRELFVVDDHALRLYLQEAELKLIAEVAFSPAEKILGVDTADLDGDGIPEAYLTIIDGETPVSQVWVARDGGLHKVAGKLPYFFRAIALDGKDKKIYVQQMGRDADFYGNVFELVKNDGSYEMKNPIKLPRFGYIYNFNRFTDAKGRSYYVLINGDGYLLVYSTSGEELWRSNDKFGGSEIYFKREDLTNMRIIGDKYRWIFLEQRLVVTPAGEIIVPRNEGMFVFGNNRSYKKNSVFNFAWNGSTLDEQWHTKESQNYLADYFYDAPRKELVILEVVKKEGILDKGASTIVVRKVE